MKRILLVDDNEVFRRPLAQILTQAGYDVEAVGDGGAALKAHALKPFDLIITDLIMPGKEGLETIMEFGRLKPRPPIVAMSGGASSHLQDYLPVARRLGAAATLSKPFAVPQLLEVVARLLGPAAPIMPARVIPAASERGESPRSLAPAMIQSRELISLP